MGGPVQEPIAIIGTGCRFPGGATSPSRLWELLRQPRDLSKEITRDRFDPNGFYHADGSHHGTSNIRHAYLLEEDHRQFDANFFQIKPVEAHSIDPQQRILLETVYEALETAGLKLHDMQDSDTAVYVGVMGGDYNDLILKDLDSIPTYLSTGTARSILSNRISYFFDWHGPSMTIDTACSSSLVAVHQAAQSLQDGTSRVAIAAGANLILGPENFIAESKLNMLSPNGRSRMWDASADGYARGDGFCAVVMKKLSDALSDGDEIECVIRGSGVNQDGRTKGITMPSSQSQAALIRQVYLKAGLDIENPLDRCQYFEAHGTGTPAGDPIEAAAIAGAFFNKTPESTTEHESLYVGSIKTVIGHTEGTAGLAGLTKASLAIRHGEIPPNLHFDKLSPSVKPFFTHLKIAKTVVPWPALPEGTPRRCSINSFGFGGTNAHIILESPPSVGPLKEIAVGEPSLIPFNFSAPSEPTLRRTLEAHLNYIRDSPDANLGDLAHTLSCRRSVFAVKTGIGAASIQSLISNIETRLEEQEVGKQSSLSRDPPQILAIFTGQGAQWAGMGRELIMKSRFASKKLEKLEGYLRDLPTHYRPAWSLKDELLASPSSSRLGEAVLAQPLCTVIQIILVDILREAKVRLDTVVGHSSGEIAAAYAAGYLSDRDALYIAFFRGFHTHLAKGRTGKPGAMMAVGTDIEDANQLCDEPEFRGRISVAAVNSTNSITLSGDADAIDEAKAVFDDEQKFARVLKVDKAYHSSHMEACNESYMASLREMGIQARGTCPTETIWHSSVYGSMLPHDCADLGSIYWGENMTKPVLFSQAVRSAVETGGPDIVVELGPHPALQSPALQTIEETCGNAIPYTGMLQRGRDAIESVSDALGFIWAHLGDGVDFEALASINGFKPRLLKDLPSFPWDHDHVYWHESHRSRTFRTNGAPSHVLLGARLPDSTEQELRWRNLLSIREIPWLEGHKLEGTVVFPGAGYVTMAIDAALSIPLASSARLVEVQDVIIRRPIAFLDESTTVETLFSMSNIHHSTHDASVLSASFQCHAVLSKDADKMTLTASGNVRIELEGPHSTSLPPRPSPQQNLVDVDTDRFYASLAELGYAYADVFRGLSFTKRKQGSSTGLVTNPVGNGLRPDFLVHPGLLDSAFQGIFLSYSWPGDGMLWSMHVPTRISRIKVDVNQARLLLHNTGELSFDCVLSHSDISPIHGDVTIYPSEENNIAALIQIEGMNVVPVAAGTDADDRQVFEDVAWSRAVPDVEKVAKGDPRLALASIAQQVTFRYPHLRILEVSFVNETLFAPVVLQSVGRAYQSYTLAMKTSSPPQEFEDLPSRVEFRSFTSVADIASQAGSSTQPFGLMIVSGVTFADIEPHLIELRALMKPGGHILLYFSPPHLGSTDAESPSRIMTYAHCNSKLRDAGFSGLDTMKNLAGCSLMISQAVDERIVSLRRPLRSTWPTASSQDLFIIGGVGAVSLPQAEEIEFLLRQHFNQLNVISSIEDVEAAAIPPGSIVLSVTDLDEPIFKNLTSSKLEGLKRLFEQAKTVLWVTTGCLSDDPYANMIVGFGRTLLLENLYLRLQFLDIKETGGLNASNTIAESLLRLVADEAWGLSGRDGESDMVWYTEPELAMDDDGSLLIPRVLPSQECNDRYNSDRRAITKQFQSSISTIECRYQPSTSSYRLTLGPDSGLLGRVYTDDNLDLIVQYSSLAALKVGSAGHLFLVMGQVASTGDTVLAFSEVQASRISVPNTWSIPLADLPSESRQSLFVNMIAHLYAKAVLENADSSGAILIEDPPLALEMALSMVEDESLSSKVRFLSIGENSHPKAHQNIIPWIALHPHSSPRDIQGLLPEDVSTFVSNQEVFPVSPADISTRIIECLPAFHRRLGTYSLLSRMSRLASTPLPACNHLRQRLQDAFSTTRNNLFDSADVILAADIGNADAELGLTTVDWTQTPILDVHVTPVDSKPLFASDKTYFLAGLVGDLGKSLAKWMVEHGARYIVLTSRKPTVDQEWLDEFDKTGAQVRVYSSDITDKAALAQTVRKIREEFPPIAGVANGAMVLEDTPIAEMTIDKIQKVLRPKVLGSIYLDEVFGQENLDFFIFFSSVAAVVGNRGQSSYSAANAFMCSLAAQRRSRGLAASVIDIGAIVGTGYLTREVSQSVQDYLQKAGYMWMSERDFHQVFAEGVVASPPTSGRGYEIMSGLRMVKGDDQDAVWYNNPKFQHCVSVRENSGTEGTGPSNAGLPLKQELVSAHGTDEMVKLVIDSFSKKLRSTLLLSADTRIESKTADELGIDSLVAVTVRSWFSKELDVDVPVMKILGGSTMESIVEYAVERLAPSMLAADNDTPVPTEPEPLETTTSSNGETDSFDDPEENSLSTPPSSSSTISESSPLVPPSRSFPMSFGQSRFWFIHSFLEDKATSNVTCLLSLKGPLHVPDFERAVRTVAQRHEGLRTCFFEKDGMPMQGVLDKSSLALEVKTTSTDDQVNAEFKNLEQHVFDLTSGDTMRIILLQRSPTLHHLIVSYHHINMDGISFMILIQDLAKIYGGATPLPSPRLQYRQFSERQRQSSRNGEWDDHLTYWKREYSQLPDPFPILPLSLVSTRKPMGRYDFHKANAKISASLRAHIQSVCKKANVTAFHFYVALFATLLGRLGGVDDLSMGIADSGRADSEAFQTIGNFLNLLPLRLRPSPDDTFLKFLKQSSRKVYEALSKSAVPIDALFEQLGVGRSTLHSPLFQTFINYRNVQETQKFGNCEIEGLEYSISRTGYDISLDVIDNTAGDSSISIMVQKDLYSQQDANILLQSLLQLASQLCDNVETPLGRVSLYSQEQIDRAIALGRGGNFNARWDTLPHAVEAIAQQKPHHIALRDGRGAEFTYKAMSARVTSIATALLDTLGTHVQATRITVFQSPGADWICSILAIMHIGATYVPLDPKSGLPRLAAIVSECKPAAIIAHEDTVHQVPQLGVDAERAALINIDSIANASDAAKVPVRASAKTPAVVLYTSGSTGTPKGIELSHYALQNQMEACVAKWNFESEVVLQQSSYSFDLSLFQIYLPLLTGGTSYTVSKETRGDAVAICKIIADQGVTVTCGVPSEYMTWLRFGDRELLRTSAYKMMVSGGEPFSTTLSKELIALGKQDLRAMNLYGPAEATISSNTIEVHYGKDPDVLQTSAPSGHTVSNYSIYILDENLDPVPAGVPGQIAIGGCISSGYVGNENLNNSRFVSDPFAPASWKAKGWDKMHLSGDQGRLRASDGALCFQGRIEGDTQVKLRGLRIDLQDIESCIVEASDGTVVTAVASVRGVDEARFIVAHVIIATESKVHLTTEQLEGYLDGLQKRLPLPQYMQPTMIVAVDSLPLTVSSKIDRRAVANLDLPTIHHKPNRETRTELTPSETALKEMWLAITNGSAAVPADTIHAGSDFFGIGGNSLLLISLQSRIKDLLGVQVSLLDLFEASTLEAMASRISPRQGAVSGGVLEPVSVDWDQETLATVDDIPRQSTAANNTGRPPTTRGAAGLVVVLTGATGFLGRRLLSSLLASPSVREVHCIAVRNPDRLSSLSAQEPGRLHVHGGNLDAPRLGLGPDSARRIFSETDVVIHNGADVSFLKSYASLRQSNVASTKALARMLLTHRHADPRRPPPAFHYVSTAGIAQLAPVGAAPGEEDPEGRNPGRVFAPVSAATLRPPTTGSNGYNASKWASERYLERLLAADATDSQARAGGSPRREPTPQPGMRDADADAPPRLRVVIHRPSSVTSPDDDAARGGAAANHLDIVQSLLVYGRKLRAVPADLTRVWDGFVDLVDIDTVTAGITTDALRPYDDDDGATGPRYVHHSGDHQFPVGELRSWLEERQAREDDEEGAVGGRDEGRAFDSIDSAEWVARARAAGLDDTVAAYLETRAGAAPLFTPRIVKTLTSARAGLDGR